MGKVLKLSPQRDPDLAATMPRVWLALDKIMTFHGVGGELVSTLRFEDVRGKLCVKLVSTAGFFYREAVCGLAVRLYEAWVVIAVVAIERGEVTRVLLEFRPMEAVA
ncbi:MAG: hypothetical protein KJ958_05600 [Gammaproteobacteria bacterium]|nr:hypothetical protein [Gammaproteobacteria bacterium]MBU1978629.1 hypothetical protein [Gammaproteobacteria bacterium]